MSNIAPTNSSVDHCWFLLLLTFISERVLNAIKVLGFFLGKLYSIKIWGKYFVINWKFSLCSPLIFVAKKWVYYSIYYCQMFFTFISFNQNYTIEHSARLFISTCYYVSRHFRRPPMVKFWRIKLIKIFCLHCAGYPKMWCVHTTHQHLNC